MGKKRGLLLLVISLFLCSTIVYANENEKENANSQLEDIVDVEEKIETENMFGTNVLNSSGDNISESCSEESEEGEQKENISVITYAESANSKSAKEKQVGWYYDEGLQKWYFYNSQGNVQKGWLNWGNKWYYLDTSEECPGIMLADCKAQIGNELYFFGKDGAMLTGWVKRPEGWYYTDGSGAMLTGWQVVGGRWYYLDAMNEGYSGLMVADAEKTISGKKYFFDVSGAMLTSWVKRPEGWYYTDGSGAMLTGWQAVGGRWYYLDATNEGYSGLMVADAEKTISGKKYFFDVSGAMLTSWVKRPEGWYYTDGSGAMITGWQAVGGRWYYLDGGNENYPGLMLANEEKEIGGVNYVFLFDGAMRVGWYNKDGSWYYYDEFTGQLVDNWKNIGNVWYYLDPQNDRKMVSNCWKKINGQWYFFAQNGAMQIDWQWIGGYWYYFGTDGGARTGWKIIGGEWYYFYTENDSHGGPYCAMACNVNIDGWQLSASGAMISTAEMKMVTRAQIYSSRTHYLILVDRATCRVGVFTGTTGAWNLQYYWSCSPGKPSTPTVAGTFTVGAKGYYFDSGSSRCYWYTQFKGNYLFHSVLYSKYNNNVLNDGRLGMQLSHGCVRLDINNAKWIYDNIPVGTTVVVY